MPKAIKYERIACNSTFEGIHGQNFMIQEIWLPDLKILANIIGEYGRDEDGDTYVSNAFYGTEPLTTYSEMPFSSEPAEIVAKTTEIEIPQSLYDKISRMAAAHKEYEDLRKETGPEIAAALKAAKCFTPLGRCEECRLPSGCHNSGCAAGEKEWSKGRLASHI